MAEAKKGKAGLTEVEVSTSDLAAIVGKTSRWIRQLTTEKVLKQSGRGKYILAEAVQAYILHISGGAKDDGKPTYTDHKTEHERIKAEKAALELEEMKGNLHAASDVSRLLSDLILTTKSRVLGVPSRIATECDKEPADVVESVVRREIETALSALAKYTPDQIGGDVNNGSPKDS
ncbi:hypothetical protein ACFWMP_13835 [Paenibacillus sp. NPDC058367]|uniref:hypothetical protein n=1 Tax=Paenibacillus sp. NPDC058367 TaxID=3346460 RepID=UPI00365D5B69